MNKNELIFENGSKVVFETTDRVRLNAARLIWLSTPGPEKEVQGRVIEEPKQIEDKTNE